MQEFGNPCNSNRFIKMTASAVHASNDHAPGGTNRVEELDQAKSVSPRWHQIPEDRKQLIFRIRRQIAENTYDTPEKLDRALERLLDSIGPDNAADDRMN